MNVLVIALDAAGPTDLRDAEVLVVAPALNSRLRHWLSDEDGARRRAAERADACVEQLERRRPRKRPCRRSRSDAGDRGCAAHISGDEVVIAAESEQVAERARKRFALPVLEARRLRPDSRAGPKRSS